MSYNSRPGGCGQGVAQSLPLVDCGSMEGLQHDINVPDRVSVIHLAHAVRDLVACVETISDVVGCHLPVVT